jgi:hypothetical protein
LLSRLFRRLKFYLEFQKGGYESGFTFPELISKFRRAQDKTKKVFYFKVAPLKTSIEVSVDFLIEEK